MRPLLWFCVRLLVIGGVAFGSYALARNDSSQREMAGAISALPLMALVWWMLYRLQRSHVELRSVVEDWSRPLWTGPLFCMPHWFFFMGSILVAAGAVWLVVALRRHTGVAMPLSAIPIGLGMIGSVLQIRKTLRSGAGSRRG